LDGKFLFGTRNGDGRFESLSTWVVDDFPLSPCLIFLSFCCFLFFSLCMLCNHDLDTMMTLFLHDHFALDEFAAYQKIRCVEVHPCLLFPCLVMPLFFLCE